jgi:hypothetical protein
VDDYPALNRDNPWGYTQCYGTLAALARTCTYLQPIATQSPYKHHWMPCSRANLIALDRLKNDSAISRTIQHIRVLHSDAGCRWNYQARPTDDVAADLKRLALLHQPDVERLLASDPQRLEFALLVAQSPNLKSLQMDCWSGVASIDGQDGVLPVWLRPILDAA